MVLLASVSFAAACGDDDEPEATETPTVTATATVEPTATATEVPTETPTEEATETPEATETGTPDGGTAGPSAPTDVRLSGELPDTSATVPPGSGELGRVTIEWEAVSDAEGYRVYLEDCDGNVEPVLEVEATESQYGPLQPCRPGGNVGVSAFDTSGESEIAWAQ